MGSSRLPNKVLKDLAGKPALWHVVERVKRCNLIDDIVVATTIDEKDLEIVKYCAQNNIRVFVGSEDDVLDRYYQTAKLLKPNHVVRITADCPMHDPEVIDAVIKKHVDEKNDYTSNTLEVTFPDGLDCEIMTYETLKEAWENAKLQSEREHVTQYIIHNNKYKKGCIKSSIDYSDYRWTLDMEVDYVFLKNIFENFEKQGKVYFDAQDVYTLLEKQPELKNINSNIIRNEGLLKSLENDTVIQGE